MTEEQAKQIADPAYMRALGMLCDAYFVNVTDDDAGCADSNFNRGIAAITIAHQKLCDLLEKMP